MEIRESESEIELSGTPSELRALGRAIAALGPGIRHGFPADASVDPAPYSRALNSLEAVASGGPTRVSVDGDVLLVAGTPESLGCFASFLTFSDADRPGTHHHHEWWEGNKSIAENSRPLVVSLS